MKVTEQGPTIDKTQPKNDVSDKPVRPEKTTEQLSPARTELMKASEPLNTTEKLSAGARQESHQKIVDALKKVRESKGPEGVAQAVRQLNEKLSKNDSIYSLQLQRSFGSTEPRALELRESDKIVSVKPLSDAPAERKQNDKKVDGDGIGKAVKAFRSGDVPIKEYCRFFSQLLPGVALRIRRIGLPTVMTFVLCCAR